ncbi:MAG: CBS domain-containing protein [Pirellulaceae bacterium]
MPRESVLAKDIMVTKLITLTADMDALEAMRKLLQHRVSGAPVVDLEGNYLGVFSEKTAVHFVLDLVYEQLPSCRVDAFMDSSMQRTIDEETDLLAIAQIFLDTDFRRLPVLRGTKLVGQISRRDLLQATLKVIDEHPHEHEKNLLYLSALFDRKDAPMD